ncbi:MAG: TRAP transporter large permease [Clostridiales bacterium]|nr:TRAP transporter large permease [Clostridiales bacterium]
MSGAATGTLLLFASLAVLMIIRIPIAFSLAISALITATYLGIPYFNLFQKMSVSLLSFTFIAVPFFIMMAQVMTDGEITAKLMAFCNIVVGRIRGGTAIVNILVSMLFGGISGSSAADVSSIGAMLIPAMVNEGYDADYSVAVTVTSSVEGVIIPPSQNMLFYALASASGISISTLLVCGYVPGILLTAGLMIPAYVIAVKKNYPLGEKHSWRENIKIIGEALIGLGAIVIVLAGTTLGICSATEAAAAAAIYALAVTVFVYRNMNLKLYIEGLKKCLPTMTMAMAIISASGAFGYVMSYLKVPQNLATWLLSLTSNRVALILLLLLMMLTLGCFMDMGILILLTTPILYPIATGVLGFSPYHFGVVLVLAYGIGLCTPPVGTSLFIGCSIAGVPVEKVVRGFMPFYLSMIIMLLLLTFIPSLSLGLPGLLGLL